MGSTNWTMPRSYQDNIPASPKSTPSISSDTGSNNTILHSHPIFIYPIYLSTSILLCATVYNCVQQMPPSTIAQNPAIVKGISLSRLSPVSLIENIEYADEDSFSWRWLRDHVMHCMSSVLCLLSFVFCLLPFAPFPALSGVPDRILGYKALDMT